LHSGLDFLEHCGMLDECIVQAPVSRELLALPKKWGQVTFFAHSPFRFLTREKAVGHGTNRTLSDLLVELSVACNCRKLVCSMFSVAHIDQNMRAYRAVADFSVSAALARSA